MNLRRLVRRLFWTLGIDLHQFHPATSTMARRRMLFDTFAIDTVLDVGANVGQFAEELRKDVRYSGHIISFEPLSRAYSLLEAKAKKDPAWRTFHCALGNAEEAQTINIASNWESSSLLGMLPAHQQSAPDSKYVGSESIVVRKLDSIFDEICAQSSSVYLKIDTQGYESFVLEGAAKSLPRIGTLQVEMSLVPLYEGQVLFRGLFDILAKAGYVLVALEPTFSAPTGQMLQIDGIFHRY
jgi:FkbM family methyltransferase